jgi:autotransporter-associated beta strand protein
MVGNRLSHSQHFNGGISNVAYYNTVLTPANVLSQYRAATSGVTVTANLSVTSASLNIAGSVSNVAALSVTTTSPSSTIAGVISGTGSVTKAGSGTLTLSGNNVYTGGTTVSSGLVQFSGSGKLPDNGAVTISGGTLNIGASNLSVSSLTISSGALNSTTGYVTGSAFTINNTLSNPITIGAILAGPSATLTKSGAGTLTLSNINTFDGATIISGGTLALSGSGSITSSSGITNNANFDISASTLGATVVSLSGMGTTELGNKSLTISNATGTLSGAVSGSGGSIVVNAGTQTLSGNNTYTGGTTVNGGTLKAGVDSLLSGSAITTSAFGTGSVTIASGAVIDLAGFTVANNLSLIGAGNSDTVGALTSTSGTTGIASGTVTLMGNAALGGTNNFTISGAIGDGGNAYALNKVGANAVTLTNTNTYTGTTTITAGSLILLGGGTITGSSLTNNATFDIGGVTGSGVSIVSLAGNSAGAVALGSKTLTITTAADTFAGALDGTNGNLTISSGTQLLTGTNGYTGTTTIDSGAILQIGNAGITGTLGSGTVTNNGSLILNRSDAMTVTNAISGSGSVVQAGSNTVILTGDNSYGTTTINSGATLQIGNA